MDSGASRTMCSNQSWFSQYALLSPPINVALGNSSIIHAIGIGRVHTHMHATGKWNDIVLQDVLFIPDLHGNLLSMAQLTSRGIEIRFKDHFCQILQNNEVTSEGTHQGDLYVMETKTVGVTRAYIAEVGDLPEKGDEIGANTPTMSTGSRATPSTWH